MQDRGGAHSRSVTQQMSTLCVDTTGRPTWLEVQLGYDVTDPHAVSALFRADRGDVTWTFARDLLVRGLTHPVGEGDVHVWPSVDPGAGNVVVIELSSPDGELIVQAPRRQVSRFVNRTLARVPSGSEPEHVDVDLLIDRLLGV